MARVTEVGWWCPDLKAAQRTILLTGKMSPRARQEFEALGWKVEEEAR